MRQKEIEIEREGQIDANVATEQIIKYAKKSIGNTLHKQGWSFHNTEVIPGDTSTGKVTIFKKQKRERDNSGEVFTKQLHDILKKFHHLAKVNGWKFKDEKVEVELAGPKQNFDIPLPQDIKPWFQHIYNLDAQIRMICRALETAKTSNFNVRNHSLLWGKPGTAKTEILLAFEKMIGGDNVLKFDTTSTSKAGAENLILERDVVPSVILMEELEKCNIANLPWMLGIMDQRGELIKTTGKIGGSNYDRKQVKSLIVGTVNDLDAFVQGMSGALASRFQHKIYCPRPSREVMEKIMMREVINVNGNPEWIKPILDYVLDVEKVNDPRRAICLLDGRDGWLDGSYPADLVAITDAMKRDNVVLPPN